MFGFWAPPRAVPAETEEPQPMDTEEPQQLETKGPQPMETEDSQKSETEDSQKSETEEPQRLETEDSQKSETISPSLLEPWCSDADAEEKGDLLREPEMDAELTGEQFEELLAADLRESYAYAAAEDQFEGVDDELWPAFPELADMHPGFPKARRHMGPSTVMLYSPPPPIVDGEIFTPGVLGVETPTPLMPTPMDIE